jgi:hypothetical protein
MAPPRQTTHDPDLVRAARHLIESHGREAATAAERRARNMRHDGCEEAATLWLQIARVVRAIEAGAKARGH